MFPLGYYFIYKHAQDLKVKRQNQIQFANINQKKAYMAILISDKLDLRSINKPDFLKFILS